MKNPTDFALQGNSGSSSESEIANILVQSVFTHFNAHLGSSDIRRLRDDVLHREHAVGLMIVQGFARIPKMPVLAIERISEADGSIIERARDYDDFESGAGFGDIGNNAIAPGICRGTV